MIFTPHFLATLHSFHLHKQKSNPHWIKGGTRPNAKHPEISEHPLEIRGQFPIASLIYIEVIRVQRLGFGVEWVKNWS